MGLWSGLIPLLLAILAVKTSPRSTIDCDLVRCEDPGCTDYIIRPGKCCPICPRSRLCFYDGTFYRDGEQFMVECNTCTCNDGQAYCTEKACRAVWTYGESPTGPEDWPELFPEYCAGTQQSPVDIQTDQTLYNTDLGHFSFDYSSQASKYYVLNNGHTIEVATEGEFYVSGGGLSDVYTTVQFHFHWGDSSDYGSEHKINGMAFPLEMHIVSLDQSNNIAVLGILFELSTEDNPDLQPIISLVPEIIYPDPKNLIAVPDLSLKNLLPKQTHKYFRYNGSLTTPSCTESVTWTIFQKRQSVSQSQLGVLRQAFMYGPEGHESNDTVPMVNTFRPTQPLNGREIWRSFN